MASGNGEALFHLPEKLRQARKQKKMTQTALGLAIGQDKAAVSKFESGARMPSLYTLCAISDALDVPLCAWFDAPEQMGETALSARIRRLPPEKRQKIEALIETALDLADA